MSSRPGRPTDAPSTSPRIRAARGRSGACPPRAARRGASPRAPERSGIPASRATASAWPSPPSARSPTSCCSTSHASQGSPPAGPRPRASPGLGAGRTQPGLHFRPHRRPVRSVDPAVEADRAAGAPRRLTDHPGSVARPAFSPDGRWVAYYRVLAGQRDIWIVPAAGGPPVQFTDDRPPTSILPGRPTGHGSPSPRSGADLEDLGRAGRRRTSCRCTADRSPPVPPSTRRPPGRPTGSGSRTSGVAPDGARDVWIVDVSGRGTSRMLATEGKAGRVVWDRARRRSSSAAAGTPGSACADTLLDTGVDSP